MRARLAPSGRSFTDVLADIFRNVQEILRSEIRLARFEVREEVRRNRGAGLLIVAGFAGALFSVFFVLIAVQYALRRVLPPWAAALCVAAGLAVLASIAVQLGMRRLRAPSARRTRAGVKESSA